MLRLKEVVSVQDSLNCPHQSKERLPKFTSEEYSDRIVRHSNFAFL